MTEKMTEFMNETINLLFNCLYIWIIVTAYRYTKYKYKYQIDYLTKDVNNVKNEQNKLLQIMIKLRNIIKVGDELTNDQTNQIKKIRKELRKINYILDIKSESNNKKTDLIEYEIDDTITVDKENNIDINSIYKITLHQQNHITFPKHLVFNQINLKKTKLSNNNHKLEFIGDDIKLISNELARFLKVQMGTCMEFNDAYEIVYNYIQENDIINISEDSNLCKLFGINENGDYEFTDTILIEILKQLLEPHFRNII
jgi:hypothetical protein